MTNTFPWSLQPNSTTPAQTNTAPAQAKPAAAPKGRFAGVADAEVNSKTPPFPVGEFLVEISECKAQESRDRAKLGTVYFVIDAIVVESNRPDVVAGQHRSNVINMRNYFADSSIKSFISAVCGADPANAAAVDALAQQGAFSEDAIENIVSPANPLRGTRVGLSMVEINVKPNEKNPTGLFTKAMWHPVTK